VIGHAAFEVDPWAIRETSLDLDVLAQTESIFALSNGHIGVRGNLDEGEPHGLPGTYLNGVYETRPLAYGETAYGLPEDGQSVVNVTNGKLIRLLVDDEPLDVRYGDLLEHRRLLDFRAGTLARELRWRSPAGREVEIRSTRLVSLVERAVVGIVYEVRPIDGYARVVLQSELAANEPLPGGDDSDPRDAEADAAPLRGEHATADDTRVTLSHITAESGLRMAAAMDHVIVEAPDERGVSATIDTDVGRVTIACGLPAGDRLRIVKLVAYGWSAERTLPALVDQVEAALRGALHTGWDGLVSGQREWLDDFWEGADVELDGNEHIQQALRFGIFHGMQAAARAERRAIPAKGLTGPGYEGHAFWDTEAFVLPLLTYTLPDAAKSALRWRHAILPLARERARVLGLSGAAFPWRTIHGEECSAYWPAGAAAFHVNADVADAVIRYVDATGDEECEGEIGLELLVETARLWSSLGHHTGDSFRIDGVTGPDEYSAIADNNVYTNLMAQQNLRRAADAAERMADRAAELGVEEGEPAAWRAAADAMAVPYNRDLDVHEQAEGFTSHQLWDFENTSPDQYPLLLHFPYFQLYRSQVVKQADIVLALHKRGDAFTPEEKARAFAYYEPLTVRDSSLSASIQAVVAAEVGHLDLAYQYLAEAALMDLDDLEHNTRDGVHIASLAGAWVGAVSGFGGMRDHPAGLSFAPRLPDGLDRLRFRLIVGSSRLTVEVSDRSASYSVVAGPPLRLAHHGEALVAENGQRVELPIPPIDAGEAPKQPHGREPRMRTR
jgi:alpha,alpha-trehalose phosphorylase